MAPIIEVNDQTLETLNPKVYTLRTDLESQNSNDTSDFIYLPKSKIYISKERSHLGENWYESHKLLQEQELKMPTIPQFREFLHHLKNSNNQEFLDIYKDITEVKSPWRSEWLDADFKVKDNQLYINYNHKLDEHGSLIPQNSEILDKNTLMKDKTPGISLESWINSDHTKQGLPNKEIKKGDLYYWNPRSDNNSVVRFNANVVRAILICSRSPSSSNSNLGVRAVRHE